MFTLQPDWHIDKWTDRYKNGQTGTRVDRIDTRTNDITLPKLFQNFLLTGIVILIISLHATTYFLLTLTLLRYAHKYIISVASPLAGQHILLFSKRNNKKSSVSCRLHTHYLALGPSRCLICALTGILNFIFWSYKNRSLVNYGVRVSILLQAAPLPSLIKSTSWSSLDELLHNAILSFRK